MDLTTLFTPWRLKWYSMAILFGLLVALIIGLFSGSGASTINGRLGGDYPAFYSAGKLFADGKIRLLYDQNAQFKIQNGLFPGESDKYMPFPYPPFVAMAYFPLSLMNYRVSFAVYTIIQLLCLFGTACLLASIHQPIRPYVLPVFVILLTFYPILRSILGGQNTIFTLFLITLFWKALDTDRLLVAGIGLGFLLFKPQFAIPLAGLCLLSGRWKTLVGFAVTAIILYAASATMMGSQWVTDWMSFATWVSAEAAVLDPQNAISIMGFLHALFGIHSTSVNILGCILILAGIIFLSYIWFIKDARFQLTSLMGLTAIILIWIQPHIMYYDIGLIILTVVALIMNGYRSKHELIFWVWLSGLSQPLFGRLGISPLFLLVIIMAYLSIKYLYRFRPDRFHSKL